MSALPALDRKLLRTLWHLKGQVLAIALVMGCGLAVFVMSQGAINSLVETRAAYYERYRFADVFATAKRAPERLVEHIERIPGVDTVATRVVESVTLDVPGLDEPATGRLISVPEHDEAALNRIVIRKGRQVAPGHPDEVVISEPFADANHLAPGDHLFATVNGRKRRLDIVGIALSPEYVYAIAPGALMPDDRRFGVLWIGRTALAAAFDFEGAFNDISLKLGREARVAEVIARLDDLLDPYGGLGAYTRREQQSEFFLSGEIDQLRAMVRVLPPIFLLVAAFLLNMVVSRLIATEREQIGLLKAFGYANGAIGWHYLKLVLAIAAVGLVVGLLAGAWLGRAITELYTQFYRFPFLYYRPEPATYAIATLVAGGAAVVGTLAAVRQAVTLPPAEAMRPPPPPTYRHRGFSLGRLGRLVDQPSRMILRHILRWPVRSALTSLGIAMAVAVLTASMQSLDAIEHLIEVQFFQAQRHDATVTLTDPRGERSLAALARLPGVLAVEPFRSVAVRFRHGHLSERGTISGVPEAPRLARILDAGEAALTLPAEGLVLSTKLAELLAVRPGDLLTVEVLEGRRPRLELPVAAVFETYLGTPAYMASTALQRALQEGPTVSGAHLLVDAAHAQELNRTLKDTPAVAGVSLRRTLIQSFRDTLGETLGAIIFFYVLFGALLAFGVLYNSARIALSERGRELASLRVLGFTKFEISYILLGELALLTLLALPLGCAIGYGLAWWMSHAFDNEVYRIPMVIARDTFGIAILAALLGALAAFAIVLRRIQRLDLIAVLKTRE